MDGAKFYDFILLQAVSQLECAKVLLFAFIWSFLTFLTTLLELPGWRSVVSMTVMTRLWSWSTCSLVSTFIGMTCLLLGGRSTS